MKTSGLLGLSLGWLVAVGAGLVLAGVVTEWTLLRYGGLWLSLLLPHNRPRVRELFYEIEVGVGAYIRSEVIQAVLSIALGAGETTVLLKARP